MDQKRARSKNFTEQEKNSLFEMVTGRFKSIIENKQTDAVTIAKKNLAWQEIAQKFNAQSQTGNRTAKQLHALYDNLKKSARSNLYSDKKNAYKTGGGTFVPKSSCLDQKIVTVLKPQFEPLTNKYDSSATYLEPQPNCSSRLDIVETCNNQVMPTEFDNDALSCNAETAIEQLENDTFSLMAPEPEHETEPQPEPEQEYREESQPSKANRKRQQQTSTSVPSKKQKHIQSLTSRFVARKNFKDTKDKDVYEKKMEILEVEHKIKLKHLDVINQQYEHEKKMNEITLQARLEEIEYERKLRALQETI